MRYADIVAFVQDGRWVVTAQQRRVALPLGCIVRPMPWWMRWMVGSLTPALTTATAIYVNEPLLELLSVETVCHEATHWWQSRKRMGALDYTATYGWHLILRAVTAGARHWHDDHEMEVEARGCGRAMAAVILAAPTDTPFDVESWLADQLPAIAGHRGIDK